MTNRLNKTLLSLACLTSVGMAHTAIAKDGFYLGTTSSYATLGHTIERDTGNNTIASLTSNAEESDLSFGLTAGYKLPVNDSLFIAGEVFYTEESAETRNVNNLLITEVSLENTYGVKLKAGVDINDSFSVYGLVGSTTLDFDLRNSYTFAPPVTNASEDASEFTIGFGAAYQLSDRFSLVAEYAQLSDADFDPIPEVAVPGKINPNELDYSTISFGVNYTF